MATKKKVNTDVSKKHGKRLRALKQALESSKFYECKEAVSLAKNNANAKFDETLEIALNLGVDPKHSDQMVRGVVSMPHGTGKKVRVAVFAKPEKQEEALKAGADVVGEDDLIEKVKNGEINFDRCIATPDMMAKLSAVAKVLGPKGLMPNPKLGTVTLKVGDAVKEEKGGKIEFRAEKAGIVHAPFGKASFGEKELYENLKALVDAIAKAKPTGAKGTYFKNASISSTMGAAIKVDISSLLA